MVKVKLSHFIFFYLLNFFVTSVINGKGEKKNILNMKKENKDEYLKNLASFADVEKIKKLISENKLDEATKLFNEMKKALSSDQKENSKKEAMNEKNTETNNFNLFNNLINPNDLQEMIKFYMYLQDILNSKNETAEKKMVKSFLRKTIQKIKDNENSNEKKSIDDIIKDTEGHQEMLEKLAELMKIKKEKLQDEEVRNKVNQILIGMLKFIDYTNSSDIANALMDEIKIKEVKATDGNSKSKLQVNFGDSKAHLEMLQKATKFMGMDIDPEELKNLTINNKWYENFLNNLLNNSDEL
ncbi:hypothetical protein MKS88_005170 [Plasmodium brasilianum]|uniref:Uncharacterized protein n=2 Tax=Plasmodium (Plasmodium) TaxID=418103 RepID=A0A1A8WD26_PLAMA|nr:conserved Plasmodium protein, unknown function [Plasmodium malariae]KAI4835951.1 hypothetical protein MKS88_005170 [Plasmodium brasilianum]SBS89929.1 conserved Plasmodium protein, unknown function [Plasmodium malariae]SCP02887.1 conserved Plasmodium protein, unknown function [Plasmodium malariae]